MEDNASLELGNVRLHFWNTPGHTLESVCVLVSEDKSSLTVSDSNPSQVKGHFTGDTVFAGDVGLPDLAVSSSKNLTSKDLAGMMFDSVQRLKQLPGHVVIYPGHGAGSSCGKNISSASQTSIQQQKDTNYAFRIEHKPAFIQKLIVNVPPPPDYFFYNAELNQTPGIAPIKSSNNLSARSVQLTSWPRPLTETTSFWTVGTLQVTSVATFPTRFSRSPKRNSPFGQRI